MTPAVRFCCDAGVALLGRLFCLLIGRLFGRLELTELNLAAYASFAFANAVYDLAAYRRPHAISLLGAAALVAIDVTTTLWLAAVGS